MARLEAIAEDLVGHGVGVHHNDIVDPGLRRPADDDIVQSDGEPPIRITLSEG